VPRLWSIAPKSLNDDPDARAITSRQRLCEPVSDTVEPVSLFRARKGISGAGDERS